ncbi:MAG: hypothetical protein RMJ54_18680 [Roseiflexaceae bacterium]|nr:hypothetical protein [Roseiflexaceae bacterium]
MPEISRFFSVEWASSHREELLVLWERAAQRQPLYPLPPLT